jgi:hypothetical protein
LAERENIVYALRDPRDLEIRYVGQSIRGLQRARDHWRPSAIKKRENPHTANWLALVIASGLKPVAEVLETVRSPEELDEAETFWIAKCRSMGYRLTNFNDGGNKPPRMEQTPEQRAAQSARMKGKQYALGRKMPDEEKLRRSAIMTGKTWKQSPEAVIGNSRRQGGRPIQDQYGRVYQTIAEAARALDTGRSCIQRILSGKRQSIFGYKFSYVKD